MEQIINLLPCPFCGHSHPIDDLNDIIYPVGAWREVYYGGVHQYVSYIPYYEREPGDGLTWAINCVECSGGCGASIYGSSKEDVIRKWNRRVDNGQKCDMMLA